MRLNIENNLNFNSRNRVIRNADDIARKVSSNYITTSVTKFYDMPKFQEYINSLEENGQRHALDKRRFSEIKSNIEEMFKQNKISEQKHKSLLKALSSIVSLLTLDKKLASTRAKLIKAEHDTGMSPIDKVKNYLSLSKKYRIGNCSECTDVAMILGHFRKINDMHAASLYTKDNMDLDHAVLYVENNGKPYIIDAWLGFADYLKNAINKYKTIYNHHFQTEDIVIKKDKYSTMCNIIKQC